MEKTMGHHTRYCPLPYPTRNSCDTKLTEANILTQLTEELWPSEDKPGVIWLNDPKAAGWQPTFAYLVYGNNASIEWTYSHATILIDIPPRNERLVDIPESGFLFDRKKYKKLQRISSKNESDSKESTST